MSHPDIEPIPVPAPESGDHTEYHKLLETLSRTTYEYRLQRASCFRKYLTDLVDMMGLTENMAFLDTATRAFDEYYNQPDPIKFPATIDQICLFPRQSK